MIAVLCLKLEYLLWRFWRNSDTVAVICGITPYLRILVISHHNVHRFQAKTGEGMKMENCYGVWVADGVVVGVIFCWLGCEGKGALRRAGVLLVFVMQVMLLVHIPEYSLN